MNDRQSITFLEDGGMKRLRRDVLTGEVHIDHLMEFNVPSEVKLSEFTTDAYLLDGVVAVRLDYDQWHFYI